ncbi:MAG TPA: undecaprenyl-phosphate galactose phosphotransferase WbaP [Rubrobacter sp.]
MAQGLQRKEMRVLQDHVGPRVAGTKRWRQIWRQRLTVTLLVLSDVLVALLVLVVAALLQGIWGRGELSAGAIATAVAAVAVWVGLRALMELYPGFGLDAVQEVRRHTYAALAALPMVVTFAVAIRISGSISRLLLVVFFSGLLVLTPFTRYLTKVALKKVGVWGKPIVIFGSGQNDGMIRGRIAKLLQDNWELGYDPVAVFDCRLPHSPTTNEALVERSLQGSVFEETLTGVADLAKSQGVNTAILAMPHTSREQLAQVIELASVSFRHVLITPDLSGIANSAVLARDLAGVFAIEIRYNLLNPWALRVKRILDLFATAIGIALILPVLLVLTLLVFIESGRPVFYSDRRMGRDGHLFACVKFRTMVPDAEEKLLKMLEENEVMRQEYSTFHKLRDDPRVTRVGRFMRKTSLDELPQLWNVLRGEMSLVGPRPYLPRESKEIGVTQSEILRVPPGVTGPWQVAGRNQNSFDERVRMDADYVRHWSVWLDLVLLARTVQSVVLRRGAS